MNKKLPEVFQNKINKTLTNNKSYYNSAQNNQDKESSSANIAPKNIRKKINDIFASPNYIYKANVVITMKDKTIKERIIGRNKNFLITMDNKTIPINDIIDIKSE